MAVFTIKHQYNREPKKRPIFGIVIGLIVMFLIGGIVIKFPPKNIFIEMVVVALTGIGLFVISSWIWGRKKFGAVTTLGILYLLVLNRLEYLNWATIGLLLVVLGLISLIN